ncbi:hypothetical protein LEMLEM_LOCUS8320, partial [Lemmus lemmus]
QQQTVLINSCLCLGAGSTGEVLAAHTWRTECKSVACRVACKAPAVATIPKLGGERGNTDTNQRSWEVLNYLGTMGKGVCHSEYLEIPAYRATEGFIPSSTNITFALCP